VPFSCPSTLTPLPLPYRCAEEIAELQPDARRGPRDDLWAARDTMFTRRRARRAGYTCTHAGTCRAGGRPPDRVARTEEWSRGLLLALYFGVSELSACARRWSDDRAGIYGSPRVCVCDGLCMVAVQFKSRARCFWRIRIYGLTLISLSHSSVLVGGVRSEATAQLRPIGWYRPSVGVPGLR